MSDYNRDGSIIAQNAGSTAAALMAVYYPNGYDGPVADFLSEFEDTRTQVFNGTLALAGAEQFVEAGLDVKVETPRRGGYNRGGAQRSAPSNGAGQTDPAEFTLNFGKYRGQSLAAIQAEDPEYLTWYAESGNNDFARKIVAEYLAAA